MEQIRSFIAIELPDELKQKLVQLEVRLKAEGQSGVKWVNPNSMHLTLKFLGNITADKTSEINAAVKESAQGISPFRLKVEGVGAFPNLRRVQVVWVGLSGEVEKLGSLQQQLEKNLEPLGFPAEKRTFTPHLTLARVNNRVSPDDRQKLGKLIAETSFEAGVLEVNAVNLMKSQLTRQGAIYSRISSVRLKS
ncbi:RNA 2',3'-cyclic phosphodiesterase [Chloroflexota bacterium]